MQRVNISDGEFAFRNMQYYTKGIRNDTKINKTKVMVIAEEQHAIDIVIDRVAIVQVASLKYLGVVKENNGKQDIEINSLIEKTMKMYHAMNKAFINNKQIGIKTKCKFSKQCADQS